jgi:hypothetical protein
MRECVFETIRRVDDEWAAIIDDRTEGSAIVEGRVRNMQATPHSFLLFLALRPPKLSGSGFTVWCNTFRLGGKSGDRALEFFEFSGETRNG